MNAEDAYREAMEIAVDAAMQTLIDARDKAMKKFIGPSPEHIERYALQFDTTIVEAKTLLAKIYATA